MNTAPHLRSSLSSWIALAAFLAASIGFASEVSAESLVGRYQGSVTMTTTAYGVSATKTYPAAASIRKDESDPELLWFTAFSIVENLFDSGSLASRFVDTGLDKRTLIFSDGGGADRRLQVSGNTISFTLASNDDPFRVTHRYVLRRLP